MREDVVIFNRCYQLVLVCVDPGTVEGGIVHHRYILDSVQTIIQLRYKKR